MRNKPATSPWCAKGALAPACRVQQQQNPAPLTTHCCWVQRQQEAFRTRSLPQVPGGHQGVPGRQQTQTPDTHTHTHTHMVCTHRPLNREPSSHTQHAAFRPCCVGCHNSPCCTRTRHSSCRGRRAPPPPGGVGGGVGIPHTHPAAAKQPRLLPPMLHAAPGRAQSSVLQPLPPPLYAQQLMGMSLLSSSYDSSCSLYDSSFCSPYPSGPSSL